MPHPTLPSPARRQLLAAASLTTAAVATAAVATGAAAPALAATAQAGKQAPGAGKAALVTGSSRGIGAATVRRLAQDGYAVTVNYLRSRDLAERVAADIRAAGGRAIVVQADVSDPAAVRRLFDATEKAHGGVDVVVSNAGIMRLAPFGDMSDTDFDEMMAVNVKGSFNVLREAARRVRDHGRIIALSSSITRMRTPTYGPYAASKGAQDLYASVLAKELAGRMVSVNAIAPGVVNTPLFTDGKTPEQIAGFAQRTPHRRLGEPEDIANTIAALCATDGWWVSGQTVFANGGIV
ncbi:SDR family oxidoreductase [Orrella dioscoreae]|uniref:Enoyl-[acyl-carrier-protein] reductase [NADPH] n=1 Tax=Orrella dioscoreae TaxID=1851544 RepID=A0A1C3K245_9BURK|nr:SDR family oxidoreductase [Orrella dioscoreae]SBT25573.1 Enoyl-[acyl-carrier-protein] reductase [NADPH] [Orrella dioscoreae]SOE51010.1 Enoyl-[acyl-carrier-protein] reductase [NADPH] [Orrella dioscoreae]